MLVLHRASPQASSDAKVAAPRIETSQDAKGVRRTVVRDGEKTLIITEDQHGNKTITGAGASDWLPVLQNIPGVPAVPAVPALPGSRPAQEDDIPPHALEMAYGFMFTLAVVIIGWPIARALGRRIDRKGDAGALPPASTEQLRRIEQAVEAMAIEVERISESQRFMAKLQSGSTAERV